MEERNETRNTVVVKGIEALREHVVAGQSQVPAFALSMKLPLLKVTLLTLLRHREHVALVLTRGCSHGGHAHRAGKVASPKGRLVYLGLELSQNLLKRRCPSTISR